MVSAVRKVCLLTYAVAAYFVAIVSLLYIMGFLADVGVPKGISDGPIDVWWRAALIDAALVGLFGLHHSITARTSFKRRWTRIVPPSLERSTYLYMSAAMTVLLVWAWRPINITLWHVRSQLLEGIIHLAYIAVWIVMAAATFHFGHFSFFGLAQAWERLRKTPPPPSEMTTRYLYALVRHPISLCWMTAALVTPHLTVGHLTFAVSTWLYIVLATPFEEADLIEALGESYLEYQKRTPSFLPSLDNAHRKRTTAARVD